MKNVDTQMKAEDCCCNDEIKLKIVLLKWHSITEILKGLPKYCVMTKTLRVLLPGSKYQRQKGFASIDLLQVAGEVLET